MITKIKGSDHYGRLCARLEDEDRATGVFCYLESELKNDIKGMYGIAGSDAEAIAFVRECELGLIPYYNRALEKNYEELRVYKLTGREGRLFDNLVLTVGVDGAPKRTYVEDVRGGAPVFAFGCRTVDIQATVQNARTRRYKLQKWLSGGKTLVQLLADALELREHGPLGFSSSPEPDYSDRALTREQNESRAWRNYAIENGLVHATNYDSELDLLIDELREALDFYDRAASVAWLPEREGGEPVAYTLEELDTLWDRANVLFEEGDKVGAFESWKRLAEIGHPHSAHSVGYCLRFGEGAEKNVDEAVKYYSTAAKRGYSTSAYAILGMVEEERGEAEAIELIKGLANEGVGVFYGLLAEKCMCGSIYGGNPKATAFLAARAYELDPESAAYLAMCYMDGVFFPVVYPYAKYCIEVSDLTWEELRDAGKEFPDNWEEIEPIAPKYPRFNLSLESCERLADPTVAFGRAQELIFADEPDEEAAKPYLTEAAEAGYTRAMLYAFMINMDGAIELLERGADEYGDRECIENLAVLFTDTARYVPGDKDFVRAAGYWDMRRRLHPGIGMDELVESYYERFKTRRDRSLGIRSEDVSDEYNAVLLRADGSFERILVDFDSLDGLYAPIGCTGINILSTERLREISERLAFTVVMYCDRRGMERDLPPNFIASRLTGYDVIWGDVVITGFENGDYHALFRDEADDVCAFLETLDYE